MQNARPDAQKARAPGNQREGKPRWWGLCPQARVSRNRGCPRLLSCHDGTRATTRNKSPVSSQTHGRTTPRPALPSGHSPFRASSTLKGEQNQQQPWTPGGHVHRREGFGRRGPRDWPVEELGRVPMAPSCHQEPNGSPAEGRALRSGSPLARPWMEQCGHRTGPTMQDCVLRAALTSVPP